MNLDWPFQDTHKRPFQDTHKTQDHLGTRMIPGPIQGTHYSELISGPFRDTHNQ